MFLLSKNPHVLLIIILFTIVLWIFCIFIFSLNYWLRIIFFISFLVGLFLLFTYIISFLTKENSFFPSLLIKFLFIFLLYFYIVNKILFNKISLNNTNILEIYYWIFNSKIEIIFFVALRFTVIVILIFIFVKINKKNIKSSL